jgi:hypothetical protein
MKRSLSMAPSLPYTLSVLPSVHVILSGSAVASKIHALASGRVCSVGCWLHWIRIRAPIVQ